MTTLHISAKLIDDNVGIYEFQPDHVMHKSLSGLFQFKSSAEDFILLKPSGIDGMPSAVVSDSIAAMLLCRKISKNIKECGELMQSVSHVS